MEDLSTKRHHSTSARLAHTPVLGICTRDTTIDLRVAMRRETQEDFVCADALTSGLFSFAQIS